MHTYEIYLASSSCDEEWEYLATLEADSVTDALHQASERWDRFPACDLVAIEQALVTSQP